MSKRRLKAKPKIIASGKMPEAPAEKLVTAKEAQSRLDNIERMRLENAYVKNFSWGNYFLARQNMVTEQLNYLDDCENNGTPVDWSKIEKVDGVPKSRDLLKMEFVKFKIEAASKFRDAWFAKRDLNNQGVTNEEVDAAYTDYVEGPVKRDSYDEKYHRNITATFVP